MMGPLDVLQDITRRFESAGVEYFLVGSLAAMYYGRPRFTNDIDLVVQINPSQAKAFERLFNTDDYYCPPIEVISDEVVRGGSFNLIHQASQIKADIVIKKRTPFSESEFARRRKVEILPGFETYIGSPEDIIIKKLEFYREGRSEKHLVDIRTMLTETQIDEAYLLGWVSKLGLAEQWARVG